MSIPQPAKRCEKFIVIEQTVVEHAIIVHIEEGSKRVTGTEELREGCPRITVEFICKVL